MEDRYKAVQTRIFSCVNANHGCSKTPDLLAVSKQQSTAKITKVYQLGCRRFGENYAQELASKALELTALDISWVFIGTIQSNKIKLIVKHATEIQSVCRLKEARLIDKEVGLAGKSPYPIYILVNAGSETSKSGVAIEQTVDLYNKINEQCVRLNVQGIMAVPPPLEALKKDSHGVPYLYRELRSLADSIGKGLLSLGMSNDLEAAIAVQSDIVRVGSSLFGPRSAQKTTSEI